MGAVLVRQRIWIVSIFNKLKIGFVNHDKNVVRHDFEECFPLAAGVDRAGGVVRIVKKNDPRLRRNGPRHCFQIKLKTFVRDGDGPSSCGLRHEMVDRERMFTDHDGFSRAHERAHDHLDQFVRAIAQDET